MADQQLQEAIARFTVWVCAQGVCAPVMHIPTPHCRRVPFCSCRVESKRTGSRLGQSYRYVDRVPVPVVPCDDAAVERAEARAESILEPYARELTPGILAEQIVEAVLRAAGETP